MEDLQKIGLAKDGKLAMDADDVEALLAGRRTDMQRLENLTAEGFHIPLLDAKLSLVSGPDGKPELRLHPIYAEPLTPSFLTDTEAEMLEMGEAVNLSKTIKDDEGHEKEVLIEFDKDTNEFIVIDTERIEAPDMINEVPLTANQKEQFRKGKEVAVDDTAIQYSASDSKGLRSDRLLLIVSILIDGGVTWALYNGLKAINGKPQEKEPGKNFADAFKNMTEAQAREKMHAVETENEEEVSTSISR